jgi:REP element-mobilizing transposase RayT
MSYSELYVHLVWSTYARNHLIGPLFEADLWAAIGEKCRDAGGVPVQIGGMPDHVHVLLSYGPALAVSRLVWELKGASSHHMAHRIAPGRPFRWQEGYGAFSVRKADAGTVASYIRNQRAHHTARTIDPAWERSGDEEAGAPGVVARQVARPTPPCRSGGQPTSVGFEPVAGGFSAPGLKGGPPPGSEGGTPPGFRSGTPRILDLSDPDLRSRKPTPAARNP